jgi:hypothetical protein
VLFFDHRLLGRDLLCGFGGLQAPVFTGQSSRRARKASPALRVRDSLLLCIVAWRLTDAVPVSKKSGTTHECKLSGASRNPSSVILGWLQYESLVEV